MEPAAEYRLPLCNGDVVYVREHEIPVRGARQGFDRRGRAAPLRVKASRHLDLLVSQVAGGEESIDDEPRRDQLATQPSAPRTRQRLSILRPATVLTYAAPVKGTISFVRSSGLPYQMSRSLGYDRGVER